LSAAGVVSLNGQMPGGALVDAARSERLVGGIAIAAICISALAYAAMPVFPVVLSASILHAAASCVLGPAIAAISLGLVGHAAIGERLGLCCWARRYWRYARLTRPRSIPSAPTARRRDRAPSRRANLPI